MVTAFGLWINSLIKRGFVELSPKNGQASNDTYVINTPITIELKPQVLNKLRSKYRKGMEIGGILAAIPLMKGNKRVLKVDRVRFLKNHSGSPSDSYRPKDYWIYYLDKCMKGFWYKRRRIPIKFHSHPTTHNQFSEYIMAYFEMSTSQQDQRVDPIGISYPNMKKTLYFPSALVVMSNENELFIGIYGGLVAPNEFDSFMMEILTKDTTEVVKNTVEWGFEEGSSKWRKVGSLLFAGLEASQLLIKPMATMVNNPATTAIINDRILDIQKKKKVKKYFNMIKEGSMEIELPKLKSSMHSE